MPNIEIEDDVVEPKANEYAETVAALIEAGEGKRAKVVVELGEKSEKSGQYLNAAKHKRLFGQAANAAGYTARTRSEEFDETTGMATFRFSLTTKQNRARKDGDTPVEAPADAE